MAWITKNSAGMRIERSGQPYLTPAMREELSRTMLPRYETKLGALLPTLHAVQHEYGWIAPQAMLEVAEFLGLSPAQVIDTASFYEEYWLRPRGKYLVQVCRSIACEFCGQPEITEAVRARLGIDVGETTDDGVFTLVELECLGSCDTAPVMLVNDKLFENLTPQMVGPILDEVAAGKHDSQHHGHGGHH